MNFIKKCCLLLLFIAAGTKTVFAQADSSYTCAACCCAKDLTPAGVMISHVHSKGEWMASYRYMNMASRGIQQNGTSISNDQVYNQYLMSSDKMRMDMHMLMAMYGISNKLTMMAMFEYRISSMNMHAPEGSGHAHMMNGVMMGSDEPMKDMKTAGFGDIAVTGLYSIINSTHNHVLFSGGLSIPTGSIQKTGDSTSMYPDIRYPYMMQLGSGTWDVQPGLTYTFQQNKCMASSQVYTTFRTGYNRVGYKLGNKISFNNWIAYRWLNWLSTSIRIEASSTGITQGKDPDFYKYTEPSANPYNYGGEIVQASAGVNFYLWKIHRIGIEAGLPLYQNLNGIQTSMMYNAIVHYSISF